MTIVLYKNKSEDNKINKSLSSGLSLSGTLRDESDVVNPRILIEAENPVGYNYAYIEEFGRYYFINEFRSVRTGLWELTLQCDVLMSFSSEILACSAILDNSTATGFDNYLTDDSWNANVKNSTTILTFSNGLSDQGTYVLITAGGKTIAETLTE